jgi:hypothetical protein
MVDLKEIGLEMIMVELLVALKDTLLVDLTEK